MVLIGKLKFARRAATRHCYAVVTNHAEVLVLVTDALLQAASSCVCLYELHSFAALYV
jgi:hypothetical protein